MNILAVYMKSGNISLAKQYIERNKFTYLTIGVTNYPDSPYYPWRVWEMRDTGGGFPVGEFANQEEAREHGKELAKFTGLPFIAGDEDDDKNDDKQ